MLEYHATAIYHTFDMHIDKIDRLQNSFLDELGLTAKEALMEFNFAPLNSSRDIAMLAVLHRRVLGQMHRDFDKLLPFYSSSDSRKHNKQLIAAPHVNNFQQCLWSRSIFALVHVYNRLPQRMIDLTCIKEFQHELTVILKRRCSSDPDLWDHVFDPRLRAYDIFT